MSLMKFSLEQIITIEGGTSRGIALQFSYAQSHEEREAAIRRLIDFSCNEFEKNKHLKPEKEKSEDELTVEIVSQLHMLGIDASHDKQQGGHCDILVEGKDGFIWIAEAKKHGSYDWLEKGFMQLSTRYSTGVLGQDTGDVIIYCWNKSAIDTLRTWRGKLIDSHPEVSVDIDVSEANMAFNSVHKHVATGRDFRIRHKIVSLFFDPKA